jgi:AbrB family looped-hinge helix DNA binding protein
MLELAMAYSTPPANFEATLADRGQIVIPKSARDELGLRPGMKLDVWLQDNQIVMRKRVKLNLDKWLGSAPEDGKTSQQVLDEIRGR